MFILAGIILSVFFVYFSYLVSLDFFRDLDYKLMVNLQSYFSSNFDKPMSLFTLFGSTEISLLILGLIFLAVLIKKKHFFSGLALFASIYLVELAGKLLIFHPKPPLIFNRYALDFHFPTSFIVNTVSSYPSGHMARSTFLSLIILFLVLWQLKYSLKKIIFGSLITLFILAMFISRIFLGEHWFSDVIGGVLLGSIIASFTMAVW